MINARLTSLRTPRQASSEAEQRPTASRTRLIARGGLVAAAVVLACTFPSAALASNVSITGSMEGAIRIANEDYVAAGYIFTIPGSHPETHVAFANAQVIFHGTCSNGSSANTLVVSLKSGPAGGYRDPANSSVELPTNDQASPETFEGSTVANVCGGGNATLDASSGATFTANVQASQTANRIQVKFHYRDPNAKGKGNYDCSAASSASLGADVCGASWSATVALTPEPLEHERQFELD